jgi:L-ascorbate metabolism protein UlaG (beta-lactamase superfamily)
MKIAKYAHACILVEEGGARIIVDPGTFNPTPDASDIDAVLITHEHVDHVDPAQVKAILARNPLARVITHEAAGKVLADAGIAWVPIAEGGTADVKGVLIRSVGHDHAVIYGAVPCRNTGFLIGDLFVPGDALHDVPDTPVRVLALPTSGPWMKLAEAIDYAKRVKPALAFPIHDGLYVEQIRGGMAVRLVGGFLKEAGIEFRDLPPGAAIEC